MKSLLNLLLCLSFLHTSQIGASPILNEFEDSASSHNETTTYDFLQSWFEDFIAAELKEGDEFELHNIQEGSNGEHPFYQVKVRLENESEEKFYWIDSDDAILLDEKSRQVIVRLKNSSFLLSHPVRQHDSLAAEITEMNEEIEIAESPEDLLILADGRRRPRIRPQPSNNRSRNLPAARRFPHARVADRPQCRLAPALSQLAVQSRVVHPGPQRMHMECSQFIHIDGQYGNYGKFLYNHISRERYPRFFEASAGIRELCPRFQTFRTDDEIKNFWVWFFMSLAHKESSCDNLARGKASMPNDTAVGIYQLSTNQTFRSHQPDICKDTIVCNPYENMTCGVAIAQKSMHDNNGAIMTQPGRTYFRNFWRGRHSQVFRSRLALYTPCFR